MDGTHGTSFVISALEDLFLEVGHVGGGVLSLQLLNYIHIFLVSFPC
jgi:hypothetical protein